MMDFATNEPGTISGGSGGGGATQPRIGRSEAIKLAASAEKHIRLIARGLLAKVRRIVGGVIDEDDLTQEGMVAAVEVAETKYDPGQGSSYWTCAYRRVRGAMVDYFRRSTQWNRRLKKPNLKTTKLPDGVEEFVIDDHHTDDSNQFERDKFADLLRYCGAPVPSAVKEMMSRYFYDGETMLSVAKENGLSESRVSQMFTEARALMVEYCAQKGIEAVDLLN